MTLSAGFNDFYRGWSEKAQRIDLLDLTDYFDKFFTLFVIYNRLYAEATFYLWRQGAISPARSDSFPDSKAAKEYVGTFLGEENIVTALESDSNTRDALGSLVAILQEGHFAISLRMPDASPQRSRDERLLQNLQSADPVVKTRAVLEFIHCIRCNTFHGSKSYDQVQIEVLLPVVTILTRLNSMLYEKLRSVDERPQQRHSTYSVTRGGSPQR
jgi:hypothetical protein